MSIFFSNLCRIISTLARYPLAVVIFLDHLEYLVRKKNSEVSSCNQLTL